MTLMLIGGGILAAVIGLFALKDRLECPVLARLAYSEVSMRIAVVGAALFAVGVLMVFGEFLRP